MVLARGGSLTVGEAWRVSSSVVAGVGDGRFVGVVRCQVVTVR